ncbi:MAG: hypothetical protein GY913_06975 [Proteobacteria bacterium]|nr:hypothetical protein [Pseudomonadota bacterium]MCP4916650.1 hypothetical protein [Pseudomonadota bacterium]
MFSIMCGLALAQDTPSEATWEATLESVVPGVVALRVVGTRSFDTESASASVGTGFVVDAENGLILTNRHMVHAGPVRAEAVFLNHEEIELEAIYRDPVHDFGFYRFDPEDLQYMDLVELELDPDGARVGLPIRVIGNDAGEKISILDGTLARLDRTAPVYGSSTYNDFNTFYLQAASGTSGGSSGSPVVGPEGKVVALNAGGSRRAASSFYLPLDRVVRALELLQADGEVTRGTVRTTFEHSSYDELVRLGLSPEEEAATREAFPEGHGLLVVRGSIAEHELLEVGDILLQVGGQRLDGFVALEAALDASVGETIPIELERRGEAVSVKVPVDDLHAITPDSYLEVGGAILHALSYQQARNHVLDVEGVYVAQRGELLREAGIPDGAVLRTIGGEPVADLDAVEAALAAIPHGDRVAVRYVALDNPRQERVAVLTMDRLWNPMQRCVRDDTTGRWPCVASPEAPASSGAEPATASIPAGENKAEKVLAPSLVLVEVDIPLRTEGVSATQFTGTGLVVDTDRGLIVVDRDTLPVGLADIEITFGGELRIPGHVVFVHPEHDIAVLGYDPSLLGDTPVRAAELVPQDLARGDKVFLVGHARDGRLVSKKTEVSATDPIFLPLPSPPQFREANLAPIQVSETGGTVGGVLADKKGRVHALWASIVWQTSDGRQNAFRGLPIEMVTEVLGPLSAGEEPQLRSLGVEWAPIRLSDARDLGLSDEQARALVEHDAEQLSGLQVQRIWADVPAGELLKGGDILLAVDGEPVTRFREVERASRDGEAELTLLRDGAELTVTVPTVPLPLADIDEVTVWAGMLLHAPHHEVASQRGISREGVYVAWFWYGTPAQRYGMRATWRIVAVDGTPTPSVEALLTAVADKGDGDSVRVRVVDLEDRERVITLRIDEQYWPTRTYERGPDGWTRAD